MKLPKRQGRMHPAAVAVLAVALLIGTVIVFLVTRPSKNEDDPNQGGEQGGSGGSTQVETTEAKFDSPYDAWKLAQQANTMLENEWFLVGKDDAGNDISGYEFATAAYRRLNASYPQELLPIANNAIARQLQYSQLKDNSSQQEKDKAKQLANDAVDAWIKAEPDAGAPYWLKARVALKTSGEQVTEPIIELLQKASSKEPNRLPFAYALYQSADLAAKTSSIPSEKIEPIRDQALTKCYEIDPGNLAVALPYAIYLAKQEDPNLEQVLADLKGNVDSVANHRVLEGRRNDPTWAYDGAVEAVTAKDWNRAAGQLGFLQRLALGYLYTLSVSKAESYPLEFMKREMSAEFLDSMAVSDVEEPAIQVSLGLTFSGVPLKGPKQIVIADVDLDNRPDLVILNNDRIAAYKGTGDEDDGFNTLVFEFEFEADAYGGFLMADVDRDDKAQSIWQKELNATLSEEELVAASQNADTVFDKADVDFVLYGEKGFLCLRNDFTEADRSRKLTVIEQTDESFSGVTNVTAACLIDFDHDSDLDIVAASTESLHAFVHSGDNSSSLTFQYKEHSQLSEFPEVTSPITSLQAGDWDRDVDIDVLVVDETGDLFGVLSNFRHGRFRWQSLAETFPDFKPRKRVRWIEADGNVSWDIVGITDEGVSTQLTTTTGAENVQPLEVVHSTVDGVDDFLIADLDNDGGQDLVTWEDDWLYVYRSDMKGGFAKSENLVCDGEFQTYLCVAAGDRDKDGDLDLVFGVGEGVMVYNNHLGNENHWLTVRSIGTQDNAGRANFHAINSMLEISSGGRYQAQFVDSPTTHFGLGNSTVPDYVRFIWPNGMPQGLLVDQADMTIQQEMYLKGSCPFVYAWNGERYEFVTDCLWAAPIGLQVAEGVAAPTRAWEYLKIPGEALQPIDGEYRIQLTEELWEAAYFDQVELICIDHPIDVEVFSNEKVGPPSIAEYRVHAIKNRRYPKSAINQNGDDVLASIASEDNQFLKGYDERLRQGLTTPQTLELDLGEFDSQQAITLFLNGWIQPTDTSLNISFSQNPEVDGPEAPSIWVINGSGEWEQLKRPMGFPGGKTKTIVVDLTDSFPTDDHRIQIRTTAEIYWDAIYYATEEDFSSSTELVSQTVIPFAADLHYRGFSKRHPAKPYHPETFDYSQVSTDPMWPPMLGAFTRYGDVNELLIEADDRMAILGSGDEMTVRFKVPNKPVPAGWKRDFMLHCVGYDKDADLNTIEGQSVEPLPHLEMKSYPYGLEDGFPDTELHEEYLKTYQTRRASWLRFWKASSAN